MERTDVSRAVAEEAHRDLLRAAVLRRPRRTRRDRQMCAYDRVRAHHAFLDVGQMHRTAFSSEQSAFTAHQLAEHAFHRGTACKRVRMTAISAESPVVR